MKKFRLDPANEDLTIMCKNGKVDFISYLKDLILKYTVSVAVLRREARRCHGEEGGCGREVKEEAW